MHVYHCGRACHVTSMKKLLDLASLLDPHLAIKNTSSFDFNTTLAPQLTTYRQTNNRSPENCIGCEVSETGAMTVVESFRLFSRSKLLDRKWESNWAPLFSPICELKAASDADRRLM
jgi:hypothetical protein